MIFKKKNTGGFRRFLDLGLEMPLNLLNFVAHLLFFRLYHPLVGYLYSKLPNKFDYSDHKAHLSGISNVCVIATHNPSADFVYLVEAVRCAGYKIIAYGYNKKNLLKYFDEKKDFIVLRKYKFGRDFGAFKHSCTLLSEFNEIKKVMFTNDSFFVDNKIKETINWFALSTNHWTCFSINMRNHFHAGSYLFQIQGKLLNDVYCFFNKYKVRNSRFHSIQYGETGLSNFLIEHSVPVSYINANNILNKFAVESYNTKSVKSFIVDKICSQFGYEEQEFIDINNDFHRYEVELARYTEDDNVLNRIGIFLFDFNLVPLLKKDCLYRNKNFEVHLYNSARVFKDSYYISVLNEKSIYSLLFGKSYSDKIKKYFYMLDDN